MRWPTIFSRVAEDPGGVRGPLLTLAGTTIVTQAMAAMASVVSARLLGPSGRGSLAAAMAAIGLAMAIGGLGYDQALVFAAAEQRIRPYFSSIALRAFKVQVLAVLVSLGALLWFGGAGQSVATVTLVIAAAWTVAGRGLDAVKSFFQGALDWTVYNRLRLLVGVAPPVGAAALLFEQSVDSFLIAYSAVGIIVLLSSLKLVRRDARAHVAVRDDSFEAAARRRVNSYALRAWPAVLAYAINYQGDQILMAAFMPERELGYYVVALSVASVIRPVGLQVGVWALPAFAGTAGRREQRSLLRRLVRTLPALAAFAVAVGLLGFLLIDDVFGAEFSPARQISVVLAGATALSVVSSILGDVLRGLELVAGATAAEILASVVTVTLVVALREQGAMGAAIASTVAYSVSLGVCFALLYRHLGGDS